MKVPGTPFSPLQRLLHWTMAVGIVAMLFIGVGMVATVSPAYPGLRTTHETLGIVLLLLVVLRLAVRARKGAPELPPDMPAPMRAAARLSHVALYGLMIAMPLIGWAMLSAAAYPVVLWHDIRLPPIAPHSDALHAWLWTAHVGLACAFFALVLAHLGAALFHGLVRRDGVFSSMAFGRARDRVRPGDEA